MRNTSIYYLCGSPVTKDYIIVEARSKAELAKKLNSIPEGNYFPIKKLTEEEVILPIYAEIFII